VNAHSAIEVALRRGWSATYTKGLNICDIHVKNSSLPHGYPNAPCDNSFTPPAPDTSGVPAAVAAAKAADIAVLFLGSDQTTEAENFDRRALNLVNGQGELVKAVAKVNMNIIIVLLNGGPIAIEEQVAMPEVRAVVEAFQPGQLGGDAILDVLLGERPGT